MATDDGHCSCFQSEHTCRSYDPTYNIPANWDEIDDDLCCRHKPGGYWDLDESTWNGPEVLRGGRRLRGKDE